MNKKFNDKGPKIEPYGSLSADGFQESWQREALTRCLRSFR